MDVRPPTHGFDPPTPTVDAAVGGFADLPEAGRPLARGDPVSRFTVLEHLGTGGMGRVYSAYDPRLDRKIALKLLRPFSGAAGRDRRARLLQEARALARLNDPHVLTLYDVGTFGDQVFLATEYVPGADLARWLTKERRTYEEVLNIFLQAGRGLMAAHEAGLVHRDFKLGNVMVRPDGRALVVDFGLARTGLRRDPGPAADEDASCGYGPDAEVEGAAPRTAATADPTPGLGGRPATQLTEAGARLGTPIFMAPEQWAGRPAGPEADQFAFCVALYLALYGELPFERPAARDQPPSWTERPVPTVVSRSELPAGGGAVAGVPPRILRILQKGLAIRPADRHDSLGELLDELAAEPGRRWRQVAVAAAFVALIGLGIWSPLNRTEPCRGGGERMAEVWNPERRGQLEAAFAGTGRAYGPDVARSVGDRLEAYASSWVEMYRDACERTHVRGEQSPEMLDRRMACLHQRRHELRALVGLLLEEPAESLDGAVSAVERLPALSTCADTSALLSVVEPPADPAERRSLEELQERLASVEALIFAGSYDRAKEQMAPLLEDAEKSEYLPVLAEVLVASGTLQSHLGSTAAQATLERALRVAQVARHDRPAAEAFVRLVWLMGSEQSKLKSAEELGQLATGMVASLDRGEDLEVMLADHLGVLALRRGEYQAATDLHWRALALRRSLGQDGGPAEARTLIRLGNVHLETGELERAETRFLEALSVQMATLGDAHPQVASTLDRLGAVTHKKGRLTEAREYFGRALEVQVGVFGPGHLRLAPTLANLANVLSSAGDPEGALALYDRVLGIYTRAHGTEHPWVGITWINISAVRNQLDDFEGAVEAASRALTIVRSSYGEEHPLVAQVLARQGEALIELGRFEPAEQLLRRALEIQRRAYDGDHPGLGHTLVSLGRAELGQGREHEAADRLEQALDLLRAQETDPVHLAWAHWMLARALERIDPERAIEMAEEAKTGFEAAAGDHSETLGKIRAWLASR